MTSKRPWANIPQQSSAWDKVEMAAPDEVEEALLIKIGVELLATSIASKAPNGRPPGVGAASGGRDLLGRVFRLQNKRAEPPHDPKPFQVEGNSPVTMARHFLSTHYDQIHNSLCSNSEQRKRILACDEATASTLIVDLINPLALGVPVLTLAMLLARIGLTRLCASNPFDATVHVPATDATSTFET